MSSVNVKAALMEAREALDNLLADEAMLSEIDRAGEMMAEAIRAGHRIYSCGNGGSLCREFSIERYSPPRRNIFIAS